MSPNAQREKLLLCRIVQCCSCTLSQVHLERGKLYICVTAEHTRCRPGGTMQSGLCSMLLLGQPLFSSRFRIERFMCMHGVRSGDVTEPHKHQTSVQAYKHASIKLQDGMFAHVCLAMGRTLSTDILMEAPVTVHASKHVMVLCCGKVIGILAKWAQSN